MQASNNVRLTRDSGFADFLRRYEVVANGEVVGHIKNGGTLEFSVPIGQAQVELRLDWCGSNTVEFESTENAVELLECGSNLRGWKIFGARKLMRESPKEWIWLRRATKGN